MPGQPYRLGYNFFSHLYINFAIQKNNNNKNIFFCKLLNMWGSSSSRTRTTHAYIGKQTHIYFVVINQKNVCTHTMGARN